MEIMGKLGQMYRAGVPAGVRPFPCKTGEGFFVPDSLPRAVGAGAGYMSESALTLEVVALWQ